MAERFRTIVADPPWPYKAKGMPGTGGRGRLPDAQLTKTRFSGASVRYDLMTIKEIVALQPPAAENAHLYLWTTNAFMLEAHQVAEAWGFAPKTILTWTKTYQDDRARVSCKTGYYFRGATEHCLFCVRGSLPLQTEKALPTAYLWPRLPHSVKPDAFYDLVEQASPGPYLEIFARRARFGWEYAGNESLSTVKIEGLAA